MNPCHICVAGLDAQVVEQSLSGKSVRLIAEGLSLSKSSVNRHLKHSQGLFARKPREMPEIQQASCGHCHQSTHAPETCRWCHVLICGECFSGMQAMAGPCFPWCQLMADGAKVSVEAFMASLGGQPDWDIWTVPVAESVVPVGLEPCESRAEVA